MELLKMIFISCVLCLLAVISNGLPTDVDEQIAHDISYPLEFPKTSNMPILVGNNPLLNNLPPKKFPSASTNQNSTGPPVLSGSQANITELKNNNHEANLNSNHEDILPETSNSTKAGSPVEPENTTKTEPSKTENPTAEQEDMLHSKYKGGQDVDEMFKPEKKATEKEGKKETVKDEKKATEKDEKKTAEKDETKSIVSKKDPKSEVDVSPDFDKKGPRLMNDTKTKSGDSMLESTSKMMAVSSSVLASTKPKHHGIIEPVKTIVSVLLSIAVMLSLGAIGLLVWKKIALRKYGRDVLINEDDFDEVSDMHTFESAQIQIT